MGKARLFAPVDLCVVVSILVFTIVVPNALSAPHASSQKHSCTPSACRSQDPKLRYEEGKSYVYKFESESITQIVGTSDDHRKLKVSGQAVIAALSPCDLTLTIQEASIQGVDRVEGLEGSSVRFSYQDGEIEGLCVSENDASWSANIKRALVSSLQNKAIKNAGESLISEDTVHGRCPTQYTVSGENYIKTRNLNACTHRQGGKSVEYGVAYNVPSKNNAIPGVNSTFTCTQNVRNGVIQSVDCEESHKLEAFARNEAGAQTTVKSSMSLISTQQGVEGVKTNEARKSSSIFYDHGDYQDAQRQKSASSNTQTILQKLCTEIETGVLSSKVPGLFLQLKKQLKSARAQDLIEMQQQITSGQSCANEKRKLNKLLLDAAAMSASDGGIGLIADVYAADKLPEETKTYFYIYTAFASRPGQGALEAMSQLLKTEKNPENGLVLAATGLAHQYCKMTNPACGEVSEYVELVNVVGRIAGNNCASKSEDKIQRAVAALQGLSNVDQLTNEAVTSVLQCLDNGSERIQIRALDSFRRNPCQSELKAKAKEIFADKKKTSEIRIQAYLASSKCLQTEDVESMNKIINKEKSNQVTSFVVSHIRNQLEISGPGQQEQKSILRQLELPTSVPEDIRKYSKNYEWSTFSSDMNLGGGIESNLIFSQDSFLPRVATVNSTVHAFGRTYNPLEMGVYLEDFEHVLEKYFGPQSGKMSKLNEIIKGGRNGLERLGNVLHSRSKRSPQPNPIPELDDTQLDAYHHEVDIENRYGRNGFGDVYMRVMGTSVLVDFVSQEQWGRRSSMSKTFSNFMDKVMEGAKDHKIDLTQPITFVDDEITVPTISGFPVIFKVEATTVLSLQLKGSIDIDQLFKNGGDTDLKAKVVPSAATVLRARMSIGAGPVESGVLIEGKILQNAAVDIQFKKQQGQFDFKINLPQEETQLLDVRTDLYWVEQEGEKLENKSQIDSKVSQNIYNNDCYTSEILGLKFCAEVKGPQSSTKSPLFPLNGASVLSLGFQKTDPNMEGYHAQIITKLDSSKEKSVSILLDTPGSKINRKIEAQGKFRLSPTVKLQLDIDSPWNNLKAFYENKDTETMKSVDFGLTSDDKAYALKAQVEISGSQDDRVYEPLLQYSSPSGVRKYIEGTVSRSQSGLRVNIQTEGGQLRALKGQIKADVQYQSEGDNGRKYELTTVELDYPSWGVGKLGLSGHVKVAEPTYALSGVATYGQSGHTLSIDTTVTRIVRRKLGLVANVKSPQVSALNFDLNWEGRVDKKNDAFVHKFELSHGSENNKLTVTQNSVFNTKSSRNFEVTNELQVLKPSSDVDLLMKVDAKKVSGESQLYELQLRSGQSHQAQLKVECGSDAYFDYNLRGALSYPGQSYEFDEKAQKVNPDSWKYETKFVSNPGHQYNAVTELKLKNERNDIENVISTTITSDAFTQPIIFSTGVLQKLKLSSAHLLVESKGTKQVDIQTEYKQTGVNRPHAINVKTFVNSYLDAIISENHTGSTSNLNLNAHWIPTDRKIGAVSLLKLSGGGEILSLQGELKWDVDKDASKVASLNSVTTLPKSSWFIESKNDLTIEGRNSKLTLKGKLARELLNGEHAFDLTYTSPDKKNVELHLKNVMESLGRTKSSKFNAKVELLDGKPYEFDWENRVSGIDFDKITFDVSSDMKYNYESDRNLNVALQLTSANPGNKRTMSGHFGIDGSVISKALNYDYSTEYKPDQFKTSLSAKHGTKASTIELIAKLDKRSPKTIADISYKVALPINPKSLEGTLKYTYVFNSWTNFEVTEHGSLKINARDTTTWNQALRTSDNEVEALVVVVDEGRALVNVSLNARNDKRTSVDLVANANGYQGKFHTLIEGQFPLNTVRASGSFSPRNSQKNYDFKLNHLNQQGGQSFETNLNVNKNGERFALSNKIENFNKRKSLELLMTDGTTPRKVSFLLTETTPRWNLESFIKWGEGGRAITTKGSLDTGKDNFDAIFSIDSEALRIDKWSARVTKKLKSGRNSIALDISGKNDKVIQAKMDYSMKSERSGDVYNGAINLSAKQARFNGDFRLENGILDKKRDGETGRQVKATVQLAGTGVPLKLTMLGKRSDVEKRASISFCNEGDEDCKIADIQLLHEYHDGGDVDYNLKATTQFIQSKQSKKTIDGVVIRASRSHNGKQYEHMAQLIINEEKDAQLGYRMYRKVGKELGLEIQLPERVVSAVAKADRSPGHDKAEISLWMDKMRKPEERLRCEVSLDAVPKTSDNAEGVETLISLKHPAMSQELKFKSKLVYGGRHNLVDFDAEFDIFKKSGPIRFSAKATKENEGTHIQQKVEIPVLNWEANTETKIAPNELVLKSSVSYQSKERQVKTTKLDLTLTPGHSNFAISTPNSQPLISFVSSYKTKSSGYNFRYEVLLPGMDATRIVETQFSSASPAHANLKVYSARGASGEFYEAFIGFRNDKQFTIGLYDQDGQERNVVGDLNIALNSSRLLFVKADWEAKNLESSLTNAQQRLGDAGTLFKAMLNTYMDESTEDSQYLLSTVTKSMLNLKPVVQAYKNEFKHIRQELEDNADTQAIHNYIVEGERLAAQYSGWVVDFWYAVTDAIENFASKFSDVVGSIPAKWASLTQKIPDYVKPIQEAFNSVIDATIDGARIIVQKMRDALKRVSAFNNVNWEFLNDKTNGVGKYMNDALTVTVNGVTKVYEMVRMSFTNLFEGSYIKSAVTKSLKRYEDLLANVIEESKVQADNLREYILKIFPQQETQELVLAIFQYAEKKAQRAPVDDEAIQRDIYQKLVTAVRKFGSEIWTIDWENGLIIAQIPLPKPIESLTDVNQLLAIDNFPSLNIKFPKPSAVNYGLTEFVNFVKADSFINTIYRALFATESSIPPVPAYALLVGSMYIRTFDGQFYHFEGNCQYLLASDFVDKNFTLAINFEGDGPKIKKAIIVKYAGETVVIKPDFSTEVRHRSSEADLEHLTVDHSIEDYVAVSTKNGALSIQCAKTNDVCLFALNGFYHGRSMGLLGTNNNEESDDFSSPKGDVLEQSHEFVATWKLDRQCKEKVIPPRPAVASRNAREQCSNAFEDKYSSLRSCYGLVDPTSFKSVCEALSSEKGYDAKKAVCSSALAYAETCGTSLIRVDIPSFC
jgi:hypothetical protein